MTNGKKNTPKAAKPAVVSHNEQPTESNKPAPALSVVTGGDEPPQSSLHAKVLTFMGSIRDLTTTQTHALAIECMEHAAKHNDLRPLLAWQNLMPKSMRKVEAARWAQSFGPIEWGKVDKKTGECDGIKLAKDGSKHFKPWNIAGATAVPFYETPEAVKPSGITDAIKQLMSQNTKYKKLLADPSLPRKEGVDDEHLRKQIATNKAMIAAGTLAA